MTKAKLPKPGSIYVRKRDGVRVRIESANSRCVTYVTLPMLIEWKLGPTSFAKGYRVEEPDD